MPKSDLTISPQTADLAEALRKAVGGFVRAVRASAETPSSAHAETLGLLDRHGPMNISALADLRSVKHQSQRLVVARLEADGLVQRRTSAEDARSQLIDLTEPGRQALHEQRRKRADVIAERIEERLSPKERARLGDAVRLIERLAARED